MNTTLDFGVRVGNFDPEERDTMSKKHKRTIELLATTEQARTLESGSMPEILRLEDSVRRERDTVILFWGPGGVHSHTVHSRMSIDADDYDG